MITQLRGRVSSLFHLARRRLVDRDYSTSEITHPSMTAQKGRFVVIPGDLSYQERAELYLSVANCLSVRYPRHKIAVADLNIEFFDRCLWRYLVEVRTRSFSPDETCWYRYAQDNKCVVKIESGEEFDEDEKRMFLRRIKREHLSTDDEIFDRINFDDDGFGYLKRNTFNTEPDRVEAIAKSIENHGWDDYRSRLSPIVIGYSRTSEVHQIISGRHRIAALNYLINGGTLSKRLRINCHYVEYEFESIRYTRPFLPVCKRCFWNKPLVHDGGTHQDFVVQAGSVRGLGRKADAKWKRIESVAKEMFMGKSVVDVGAHRGLYCMKALQCGAIKATAFEPNSESVDSLHTLKAHTGEERLDIYQGDFYEGADYTFLLDRMHDTAMLLGIIHHLLRIGIAEGALHTFGELFERIARIVRLGVIVEFAMPTEASLELEAIEPYRSNFSIEEFERGIGAHFSVYKNLGRCQYKSGHSFGRFMYFACNKL